MWKWKSKDQSEAPAATRNPDPTAWSGKDTLGEMMLTINQHMEALNDAKKEAESLTRSMEHMEETLKGLAEGIDRQEKELTEARQAADTQFASIAAIFNALSDKVKQGNIPTSPLATAKETLAGPLQRFSAHKGGEKPAGQAPGA